MKAEELRIGNYVSGGVNKDVAQITEIRKNGVMLSEHEDCPPHYYDWIQPVPITEEWLVNQEFEKLFSYMPKEVKYKKGEVYISQMYDLSWVMSKYTSMKPMRYVHELQNAYYVITGEEL